MTNSCTSNLTSHFIFCCRCFFSNPVIVSEKCVFMFLTLHWLVLTLISNVIPYYANNFENILFFKKYSLCLTYPYIINEQNMQNPLTFHLHHYSRIITPYSYNCNGLSASSFIPTSSTSYQNHLCRMQISCFISRVKVL